MNRWKLVALFGSAAVSVSVVFGIGSKSEIAVAQEVFDIVKEAKPWGGYFNEKEINVAKATFMDWTLIAEPDAAEEVAYVDNSSEGNPFEDKDYPFFFCTSDGRVWKQYSQTFGPLERRTVAFWFKGPVKNPKVRLVAANWWQTKYLIIDEGDKEPTKTELKREIAYMNDAWERGQFWVQHSVFCPATVDKKNLLLPDGSLPTDLQGTLRYDKLCLTELVKMARKESGDSTLRPCSPNSDPAKFDAGIVKYWELINLKG